MTKKKGIERLIVFILVFLAILPPVRATRAQSGSQVFLPLVANDADLSWVWQPPTTLTLTPTPWNALFILLDHQGRLHLFWDTLSSPRFIYHTFQTDAGWAPIAPVSMSLGISELAYAPILDAQGTIHLLWKNDLGSGTNPRYRLLYSRFEGIQWSDEEVAAQATNALHGMVHFDDQGRIMATYRDSWGVYTFHTVRSQNGWSTPVTIEAEFLPNLVWPDLHGGIHFFRDAGTDVLEYAYWKNWGFLVNSQSLSGELTSRSTQLDQANNLHTYWTAQVPVPGGTVQGVYHRCLAASLTWGAQTILSGQAAVGSGPAKGWDSVNRFGLLWEESQSGQIRLALWDGCTPTEQHLVPFTSGANRDVAALAVGTTPNKVCALMRKSYAYEYTALCATINR